MISHQIFAAVTAVSFIAVPAIAQRGDGRRLNKE
jgi:hypothetical protein